MKKYGVFFLIKLLRFTLNFSLFIGLVGNEPFFFVFTLVLLMAVFSFLVGDLLILPRFGSTVALLLDAPMIFGGIWAIHALFGMPVSFGLVFLFGLITVASSIEEFAYHIYVERNLFGKNRPSLMEIINKL